MVALNLRKQPRIYLPRWRDAAKGQPCVGCDGMGMRKRCDPSTTVPAHIKIRGVTNHGERCKPDDMWIAFLGFECHEDLDHNRAFTETNERLRLVHKTWRALFELGILQ